MKKVYVIGHRNPDTDSICSAIAYANLKNQVEGNGYEAYRAGNINGETRYVLDTFGIKDPKYVSDVRPRLTDINLNSIKETKPTNSPEQTPPPVHGRYSADSVSTDPHTVPHQF